jgi:hypothetical protein
LQGFEEFIKSLPVHLQMDITMEIHKELFMKFPLFSDIGNKNFLAWVGSCLNQEILTEG